MLIIITVIVILITVMFPIIITLIMNDYKINYVKDNNSDHVKLGKLFMLQWDYFVSSFIFNIIILIIVTI